MKIEEAIEIAKELEDTINRGFCYEKEYNQAKALTTLIEAVTYYQSDYRKDLTKLDNIADNVSRLQKDNDRLKEEITLLKGEITLANGLLKQCQDRCLRYCKEIANLKQKDK